MAKKGFCQQIFFRGVSVDACRQCVSKRRFCAGEPVGAVLFVVWLCVSLYDADQYIGGHPGADGCPVAGAAGAGVRTGAAAAPFEPPPLDEPRPARIK